MSGSLAKVGQARSLRRIRNPPVRLQHDVRRLGTGAQAERLPHIWANCSADLRDTTLEHFHGLAPPSNRRKILTKTPKPPLIARTRRRSHRARGIARRIVPRLHVLRLLHLPRASGDLFHRQHLHIAATAHLHQRGQAIVQ